MFHFVLMGSSVSCDTADELLGVLDDHSRTSARQAATNGDANAATTARKPRAKKKRNKSYATDELWAQWKNMIPVEKGKFDFKRVARIAKKINWEGDIRALRSFLVRKRREAQIAAT